MLSIRATLIIGSLLFLQISASSQYNTSVRFRKFTQSEGLSSYNITKIFEDQNGFFWIATQDGLNCFDGKSFKVFSQESNEKTRLNGNQVMDVLEDTSRQRLWVTTSYGGIQCISTITYSLENLSREDEKALRFSGMWIHSLALYRDVLWIGTHEGLHAYNLLTHRFLELPQNLKNDSLRASKLMANRDGLIWVCCDAGCIYVLDGNNNNALLYKFTSGELNFFNSSKKLLFWNVTSTAEGELIFATNWGIRIIKRDTGTYKLVNPHSKAFFYANEIFSCLRTRDKSLLLSDQHGLYKVDAEGSRIIKVNESLDDQDTWQTAIYALYESKKSYIWLGSEEGLLYSDFKEKPFTKFYKSATPGTKIQHAFSIFSNNDSMVYCGAANGLYATNIHTRIIRQIDKEGSCYLIAQLASGQMMVSNKHSTSILKSGNLIPIKKVYPELSVIEGNILSSFAQVNDSIALMGSESHKELYVWNIRRKTVGSYLIGQEKIWNGDGIVNAMYKDKSGDTWIVSVNTITQFNPSGGGTRYHVKDPNTNKDCAILLDMCETKNSFWLAGYGMGLIETDKKFNVKQIISEKEGLTNNGVYKVFAYRDSLILISSNKGLSILNISTNKVNQYYVSDGLQANGFEQFCGYMKSDTFFLGGVNGFTMILPKNLRPNKAPPKVYFTRALIHRFSTTIDTTNLEMKSIEIPNDVNRTSISFAGINFSNPEKTTFAYKIKELNNDWINLGSQNFIDLIGLKPSTYTLQVKAANEDGVWSIDPAELKLVYLPKWYQTIVFKVLLCAAFIAIVWYVQRYRLQQISKQHQIRREIASDLHDDLGSTLNSLKIYAHLAKAETNNLEILNEIESSITYASSGLRDMIWVLDDSRDSLFDLADRIKKFALPICIAQNIQFEANVDLDNDDEPVSKDEKKNLLLIAKEAINNSIKYAECTQIKLLIKKTSSKLLLSVTDNGKGFDPSSSSEGNGQKNIKQRAKQIGYFLSIRSGREIGTSIELTR